MNNTEAKLKYTENQLLNERQRRLWAENDKEKAEQMNVNLWTAIILMAITIIMLVLFNG
ncbi:hypothetical protein [Sediminibacillus massiliensis]|uniref:hypothetical protein n=1 Tax=Sediminibacillus massiliensis TaxID=1926277 RepID=UPI0015C3E7D3|nr:hypothetical protein [Sediminibacillus massiliensis]